MDKGGSVSCGVLYACGVMKEEVNAGGGEGSWIMLLVDGWQ